MFAVLVVFAALHGVVHAGEGIMMGGVINPPPPPPAGISAQYDYGVDDVLIDTLLFAVQILG